jgi:hypothetical protein
LALQLSAELKEFIQKHEHADVSALLLKHKTILDVPASFVADQLNARKKARIKFPTLYSNLDVIYPPGINLEQSSSEKAARFKADFISKELRTFDSGVDLTGGFGIDALFISPLFNSYAFVEPNADLLQIAVSNHKAFHAENISYKNISAEDFLTAAGKADFAYIDPSRRTSSNQKVFSLSQCEPDVTKLQDMIFTKTNCLLVKASPLLDIQIGLKELRDVKTIIVLSIDNECKELLFFCEKDSSQEVYVQAVNLERETREIFDFKFSEERLALTSFSEPLEFLYEPNASILKAGAFKLIAMKWGLHKLHQHTHLYTSKDLKADFPGRIFKVKGATKADQKSIAEFFPDGKANITTRNYPLSVDELRKKTGLKDGGNDYLIGLTDPTQKMLIAAERIT